MKKTAAIVILVLTISSLACGSTTPPLPTLAPTAAAPASSPMPTSTYEVHQTIDELVYKIAGVEIKTLLTETLTEYKGQTYPEGRIGYDIDITVTSPDTITRAEMLQLAYDLTYEFFYNFSDTKPMYLTLHLRAHEGDSVISGCVFGLGIGYQAISSYLSKNHRNDLENWFRSLEASTYYGDLPGETEALLAYGNDPAATPGCTISEMEKI